VTAAGWYLVSWAASLMTGSTSPRYALPGKQNECCLLTNCPYEVDTCRLRRVEEHNEILKKATALLMSDSLNN
jgi:hypothetical protein